MDTTTTWLLVIAGIVGAASLAVAARVRLPFRIAMRNVRRGRWRTVLVVLGLLVGTTIVSSSLVIGDTVNSFAVHFTYQAYGFTDEGIYGTSVTGGAYPFFNASLATAVGRAASNDPQIVGVTPEIVATGQIFDRTTGIPQTNLNLIGVDPNASRTLGSFTGTNAASTNGPSPGEVLLDATAASDINASVGDRVVLYGAVPLVAIVQGIVNDDTRGGFLFGGNLFVNLATAEQLENVSGQINFIAITNAGSLTGGVGLSDSVSARLNATLASVGAPSFLIVHELLKDNLASAVASGQSLTTLFLVLGLFSIVAGAMLIVGIFVTLAEERKGEMGMLRAVGLRRRDLVLTYYFEGLAYSAGSALAGTLLGVAVGYGLIDGFTTIFSGGGSTGPALLASFAASTDSLVLAYVVGFLLTLATVAAASWRTSRLNIVRAIRSIPEPAPPLGAYTRLAYLGLVLIAIGGYLFIKTFRGTTDLSYPIASFGTVIAGAGLVASRFVRNRYAFSATGASLLAWGGSEWIHKTFLGSSHTGNIGVFFVDGILMVLGAILLYTFNADLVVGAVTRLASRRPSRVPVVRIGLSYPSRRPFRTAINLTIFALVLFTVIGVASFGSSLQLGLANQIQSESGGYSFFAASSQPIPNLPALIANNSSLSPLYADVVPLVTGTGLLTFPPGVWNGTYPYPVFSASNRLPPSENFYATNRFNFSELAPGYTAGSAWSALGTNASVAVVDNSFMGNSVFSTFGPARPAISPGAKLGIASSTGRANVSVTVIGILGEGFVGGVWVSPASASALGFGNATSFFLRVAPGVSTVHAAQLTKTAFFAYGLVLFDFAQILQSSIQSTLGFIGLLEVFVALGLAVGIAALGIVALRAVVERRSEIGMLRATGMTRGAILRVFLLEYSYVALLGIAIGTLLGILLNYNAAQISGGFLVFSVPAVNIGIVVASAYLLTLAAVAAPSRRAARLPPAEALRYSE